MSRYRFFFNPIRYTSLGLAVCEAMMLGIPIIGLATTEMVTAVENGVSGYVGHRHRRLIERMRQLLADPRGDAAGGRGSSRSLGKDSALSGYTGLGRCLPLRPGALHVDLSSARPVRALEEAGGRWMTKRIAFISDHASPVGILGGVDSGGQNVTSGNWPRISPPSATRWTFLPAGTASDSRRLRNG